MSNITMKRKQELVDGKITSDYIIIRKERSVVSDMVLFLTPEEFEYLKELIKKYE